VNSLMKIMGMMAIAMTCIGFIMYYKKPQFDEEPRERNLHGLIDDIGSGRIFNSHEVQSYHLLDPRSGKSHTVLVGTEDQFHNTKRFRIGYTTLRTPIGVAVLLHSRVYVMYQTSHDMELLLRMISNNKITYLPMQVVERGMICNGGVFMTEEEFEIESRENTNYSNYG